MRNWLESKVNVICSCIVAKYIWNLQMQREKVSVPCIEFLKLPEQFNCSNH